MALEKGRRGSTNADNQVGRAAGIERAQIIRIFLRMALANPEDCLFPQIARHIAPLGEGAQNGAGASALML